MPGNSGFPLKKEGIQGRLLATPGPLYSRLNSRTATAKLRARQTAGPSDPC
jgi:hypothetical protein